MSAGRKAKLLKSVSPENRTLGQAVRAWREERRLTLTQLAQQTLLPVWALSKVEHDHYKAPNPDHLQRIARALGVSIQTLSGCAFPPIEGGGPLPPGSPSVSNALTFLHVLSSVDLRGPNESKATIQGPELLLRTVAEFLEAVPPATRPHDATIWMCLDMDVFAAYALLLPLRQRLMQGIRSVMDKGWHIQHLMPPNQDPASAYQLLNDLCSLLRGRGPAIGSYHLAALPATYKPTDHGSYIVVPGRGACRFRPSRALTHVYAVTRYTPSQRAFAFLGELHRTLWSTKSPLVRLYRTPSEDYSRTITEIEQLPGDICLVLDGISHALVPISIQRMQGDSVKRKHYQQTDYVDRVLQAREERQKAFETLLLSGVYRARHVYPAHAIDRLIRRGIFSEDDSFTLLGADRLEPMQCRQILETLVKHLDRSKYPTFELRLVKEDSPVLAANPWPTSWLLKQGHAIFVEKCYEDPRTGKLEEVDLVITHKILVDAFYEYFVMYLWDQLPSDEATHLLSDKVAMFDGKSAERHGGPRTRSSDVFLRHL